MTRLCRVAWQCRTRSCTEVVLRLYSGSTEALLKSYASSTRAVLGILIDGVSGEAVTCHSAIAACCCCVSLPSFPLTFPSFGPSNRPRRPTDEACGTGASPDGPDLADEEEHRGRMAPSDSDSASVGSEDRPASFHTTRSSSDSPDAVDPTTRTVASQPDLAPLSPTSPAAAGSLSAPDLSTPPSSAGPLPTASRQDSTAGSSRMTPGLQVRAGLISRIYRGLGEMRGNRRLGLMLMGIVTLAQLVAFVTVLALSSGQQCDEPLQAYIIVHTVRVTLSWPASFYIALAPRRSASCWLSSRCKAEC